MTAPLTPSVHLDWSHPDAMAHWQASCEAERAITRATGKTALERSLEAIDAAARRARLQLVKNAARRYRARPAYLDSIALGLSMAHPAFILATVEHKARIPFGRVDMLGVIPVNLAGAALYARWLRLEMRREAIDMKEVAYG